jgi:hypothetical protein
MRRYFKMLRINGIITEATRKELEAVWLEPNWHSVSSLESFIKIIVQNGCTLKEEVKEKCDCPIDTSAQNAPITTLVPKTTASVKPLETPTKTKEKPIVSDTTLKAPVQKPVNIVNMPTPVTTEAVTLLECSKLPIISEEKITTSKRISIVEKPKSQITIKPKAKKV